MQSTGHSPTGHEQDVARTFALSIDQLDVADVVDALAIALLNRAAHFAPGEPIPRDLLLSTAPAQTDDAEAALQLEDALQRLTDLGMLELDVHRSTVDYVRPESSGRWASAMSAVVGWALYGT